MPGFNPYLHYNGTTQYSNVTGWTGSASTDSSGNAIFYVTSDGTSGGSALFSTILAESIQLTPWSTSRIILLDSPVISSDKKTVTIPVKYNSSLLSLGLVPFATAAAGIVIHLSLKGIQ